MVRQYPGLVVGDFLGKYDGVFFDDFLANTVDEYQLRGFPDYHRKFKASYRVVLAIVYLEPYARLDRRWKAFDFFRCDLFLDFNRCRLVARLLQVLHGAECTGFAHRFCQAGVVIFLYIREHRLIENGIVSSGQRACGIEDMLLALAGLM